MTRCERKGCGGLMVAFKGACKCGTCNEIDAPMDTKVSLTPQEQRTLAYWWRRQFEGYGEFDVEDRY